MDDEKPGKLFAPPSLFIRHAVGNATDQTGTQYELSIHAANRAPLIRNKKTGVWFGITWSHLIALAKARGIDNEWKEETDDPEIDADSGKPHQKDGPQIQPES